jgi:putative Mg2+ transporter-C (MgtC) family protein
MDGAWGTGKMTEFEVFTYRMLLAFLFGAAIGAERQWHQKMAGLRTNVLVSVGAACFVTFSDLSKGADPTRVAAQVVSGIGFLGAGVIMRDGFNVHGLNTAATLWCSAAVGCLAGAGHMVAGAVGSALIVLANSLLRPAADLMNRHLRAAAEGEVHYGICVVAAEAEGAKLRAELLEQLAKAGIGLEELKSADTDAAGRVEITAAVVAQRRNDAALEAIVGQLSLHPLVSDAKWQVVAAGVPRG